MTHWPEIFFYVAIAGLLVAKFFSALLLRGLSQDEALTREIFSKTLFMVTDFDPRFLRVKYFLPWVPAPQGLAEYRLAENLWFRGARIGGTTILAGLLGTLTASI